MCKKPELILKNSSQSPVPAFKTLSSFESKSYIRRMVSKIKASLETLDLESE